MSWNPVMMRQQWLVNYNGMNIHKVTTSPIVKPRDFVMIYKVTHSHKIINMQKLWRRDYNFNVNKDQLPMLASTRIFAVMCDFLSFKSTTHDIIEFNPVFLVIVASHIRPRTTIIASFTSMLRIEVKDCDHRSQPDVWGNNDHKHMIKPLLYHGWFSTMPALRMKP